MTGSPDRTASRITSVLICSDILATRESEQHSNLRWFGDLLARPIRLALPDASVQIGAPTLDRGALLTGLVTADRLKERHCWFDADAFDASRLRAAIAEGTLVVGYELSWMTRKALTSAGVPWIDIWLHPVRFADDILFAIRASDPSLQERVAQFALPDERLAAQADLLRVQSYRGANRTEVDLSDGAALFVGQTAKDKSVLVRDGFLDLLDFQDEFAGLARDHPHVYFSRHPHQPHLPGDIRDFLGQFGNVSETTVPTYHLLADERIAAVASISSSVLEEARYFGKRVHRFHQPPYPLEGAEVYATVLHAPCFAHFWATVLRDAADVADTQPAGFIDPKSKLREALNFTWGYGAIAGVAEPAAGSEEAAPTVETAELVTFDVFDTLITRKLAAPRDVFDLMAGDAVAIVGGDPLKFATRRASAEVAAAALARKAGREDPTLAEIYASLSECPLEDDRVAQLCALEIATEAKVVTRRPAGAALFEAAKRAGRRIVLVSDMYLPPDAVEALLQKCGYGGWEKLHVSSEAGRTKRSGALFEVLHSDLGVSAKNILHIGDNPKGDVARPAALGIATRPLPRAVETMREATPFLRAGMAKMSGLGGSEALAQIATTHFDIGDCTPDGFARDAKTFGYAALGPLLAGFSEWLHREASMQGVERLGFLTREGPVLRAAYEAMYPDAHLPAQTVIGSRRMVQAISLKSDEEIEDAVLRFGSGYSGTVGSFMQTHLGVPQSVIQDDEALVRPETAVETLRSVARLSSEQIKQNARDAKERLQRYLHDVGVDQGCTALVDIGYSGQMQAAYSRLTGVDLPGFYLATFRKSVETLGNLPVSAFLAEKIAPNESRHGICRHRQIYETLLCAPGPSFVGVVEADGEWRGIPSENGPTPLRDAFVREAHDGALAFVREFAADRVSSDPITPGASTALIDAALDDPTPALAEWLGRLEFDDSFAFEAVETLIDRTADPSRSVWSEGAAAISTDGARWRRVRRRRNWQPFGPYGLLGWRHALSPIVAPIIARIGDAKDADHFRDDPIAFFRRLSDPRYRRIGRLLYPWD